MAISLTMNIPIIILAAGGSTRLGRAKQLLTYQGKTFLRHAVDTALGADSGEVIVVLGSRKEQLRLELQNVPIREAVNPDWKQGMGSSIIAGMNKIPAQSQAVILMLCDQPRLSSAHLRSLISSFEQGGHSIIASAYGGNIGVPALFSSAYFSKLSTLSGHAGAKKILLQAKDSLISIPFPDGVMDVDTEEDYDRLLSSDSSSQS